MAAKRNDEGKWASEQIEIYTAAYPRYAAYARLLQEILVKAVKRDAPLAIIQTRPKSIPSFAEKAIRKKKAGRYSEPLLHMTDLCGGRVITQTQAEVQAVSQFIEQHFLVDAANSVDVSERLKPAEFGYRSIHYVVQLRPGVFPTRDVPIEIPPELFPEAGFPMKAEIQVRTVLEHGWAGFAHDRVYKSAFAIPPKWQRELAVLAGVLEQTDGSFSRIQAGLRTYAASYGAYMNEAQLKDEIAILETVLTCDPHNPDLAYRIGKLAMELGDWQKAIDVFSRYVESGYGPILRDLGVVLCKVNATDPQGTAYRQGQAYLEMAVAANGADVDALASLAGTWKAIDPDKTRSLYRRAFEADPSDPYAVSNYLVYEIVHQRSFTPAALMSPSLAAAIRRSQDQADVGMNLPWAFYNLGLFHLLLGRPYASLGAYARAIQLSNTDWLLETSLRLIDRLAAVREEIEGYDWARTLLALGRAAFFGNRAALESIGRMAAPDPEPITGPVVILAGGTSPEADSQIQGCRSLLLEGFKGWHGTLVGGGTTAGISGLAGEIRAANARTIRAIGYAPREIPSGAELDPRYDRIRRVESADFDALGPLQYWIDLVSAGIQPGQVRLLGVNGGEIAAFEFRLALVLGARVGLVEGSGREADRIFQDAVWAKSPNLVRLSADPQAVDSFLSDKA